MVKLKPLVLIGVLFMLGTAPARSAPLSSVEWLDKMERLQAERGDLSDHVHAAGRVEAVDAAGGLVTLMHPAMKSGNGRIEMPMMRMTFHVISSSKLNGMRPGDSVRYVVGRHRGAIMITDIWKAR